MTNAIQAAQTLMIMFPVALLVGGIAVATLLYKFDLL